jgi:hypothetical protein
MLNLISRTIGDIRGLVTQSIAKLLPIFLVGVVLLTSGVDRSISDQRLDRVVDQAVHQDNEKRPKTTEEWQQQQREVQGKPGELLKRVGEQSAEAIEDFGSVFPDTAKRTAAELKDSRKANP